MQNGYRVLMMERHVEHATAMTAILRNAGYHVTVTDDGSEGCDWAFIHQPHVILLDIELHSLDGFQVLIHLKHIPATARIPIIMVTDRTWMREWRLASKLGADVCLCIEGCLSSRVEACRLCDCITCLIENQEAARRRVTTPPLHCTQSISLSPDEIAWQPGRMTMCRISGMTEHDAETEIAFLQEQEVGKA